MPPLPTYRDIPILLLDLASFTKLEGVEKKRLAVQELQKVLTAAARFFMPFGDPWQKWKRHGTGDGYYFLFDALDAVVAAQYALAIRDELAAANRDRDGDITLRARIVLAHGDVELVDDQLLSESFAVAERFISDERFKKHSASLDHPAAIACTDLFHVKWQDAAKTRTEEAFARARTLPWTKITVTDKHGNIWRGYIEGEGWKDETPAPAAATTAPPPPPPPFRILILIAHGIRDPLPEAVELAKIFVRELEAAKLSVEVRLDAATVTNLRREALAGTDLFVYYGHGSDTGRLLFLDQQVDYALLTGHGLDPFFRSLKGVMLFACYSERFAVSLPCPWVAFTEPILKLAPRPFVRAVCHQLAGHPMDEAITRAIGEARVTMKSNLPTCLKQSDTPFPAVRIPHGQLIPGRTIPALTGHVDVDFGSIEQDGKLYPEHDPFVGRDTELGQLALLPGVDKEQQLLQLWWVHGTAGLGKSALLRQHAAHVRDIAFHERAEPVWLLHLHCHNFILPRDIDRGVCEKAARLYHLSAPPSDLKSLLDRMKTILGTHVWILDDLTYLRTVTQDTEPVRYFASELARLARDASLPIQIVASARFPIGVGWEPMLVPALSASDAARLATRIWEDAGKTFPADQTADLLQLLVRCDRCTVHLKRALLLAVERDIPLAEFVTDHLTTDGIGEEALDQISQAMVKKEVELLGQLENRNGFAFQRFLSVAYPLLMRAGHFTRDELEAWFGDTLRAAPKMALKTAYTNGLTILVRFGFLGVRRVGRVQEYYLPPNQRMILRGLAQPTETVPAVVPLRAPKARLSAALEGIKVGSEGALEELLAFEDDYRDLAHEPHAALAVVYSLRAKAELLGDRDPAQVLHLYERIDQSFHRIDDLDTAEQVATALRNKGVTLGQLGRSEEEVSVYDEVVTRYGTRTETAIAEQVASALRNKGVTLGQLGRSEEEVSVYDEVVTRYGTRTETAIAEQVAKALRNKGVTLGQLGRSEDAVAVYDEVVTRYGTRTETAIANVVDRARAAKAKIQALPSE